MSNRSLLCLSFDKYQARKEFPFERHSNDSPHDERFVYHSFLDNRAHGLTFDKQTDRKFEALNSGVTCLDYDYDNVLEKYKYDQTIKKTLPF